MRLLFATFVLACLCLSASADPPPVPFDARPSRPTPQMTPPPSDAPAVTIEEFVRTFKSVPGRATYEVVFVHPCTCKPVKVCIDLPDCPKRIKYGKTEIVFRYGLCKKPVTVTFCRDGGVLVR
jgi:hypothetical protein